MSLIREKKENLLLLNIFTITILFLQACAEKPLGSELADNFDYPDKQKSIRKIERLDPLVKPLTKESNSFKEQKVKTRSKFSAQKDEKRKSNDSERIYAKAKKINFDPLPYRIIIKISEGNPSAPAETVTKALRKAGVQFEVEKIEQFNQESLLNNTSSKK